MAAWVVGIAEAEAAATFHLVAVAYSRTMTVDPGPPRPVHSWLAKDDVADRSVLLDVLGGLANGLA